MKVGLMFLQSTIYEVAEPESNRASKPKAQHTGSTRDRGTREMIPRGCLGEIRTMGNSRGQRIRVFDRSMTQSAGTGKRLQTTEDFRGLSTKRRADLVRMPSQTHTLEKTMVRQLGKCKAIKKVLVLFLL